MKRRKKKDIDIIDLLEDFTPEDNAEGDSWTEYKEAPQSTDDEFNFEPGENADQDSEDLPVIDEEPQTAEPDEAADKAPGTESDVTPDPDHGTASHPHPEEIASQIWDVVEEEDEEEDSEEDSHSPDKMWLVILLLFVLIIAGGIAIFFYLKNNGAFSGITQNTDNPPISSENHTSDEASAFDLMVAAPSQAAGSTADDGETVIVTLGNAPFADDRASDTGLANLIASLSGATVYNCAVDTSYLCAESNVLSSELAPFDAFNLYWLTTTFCQHNNKYVYEDIFLSLGENMPSDGKASYDQLQEIDFAKVDVIAIMYDASDYLAGHSAVSSADDLDIRKAADNLGAAIELISQTYPHIRIIVMSPTYASEAENSTANTALYRFISAQYETALKYNVTFIDNYHGDITEETASQYLLDNIHLNEQGRQYVAERFVDALVYFEKNNGQ